jgi:ATP-dependent Clp protease adaptor protein ClpS
MVRSIRLISTIFSIVASTSNAFAPQHNHHPVIRNNINNNNNIISSTILSAHDRNVLTMMPAVLDKPTVRTSSGGPAVLDRPVIEKTREKAPVKETKRTGSEAWEVRIYNDGTNTREFVARCLVQVTGLSEITAYQTMMQAHQNGVAVVGRYVYEIAEMYHNALKKNGIVCDLVPVDEEK